MAEHTFLYFCLKVRVLADKILRSEGCFGALSLPLPSTMLESSVQRLFYHLQRRKIDSRLLLRLEWRWDLASLNCQKGLGLLTTSQHQSAHCMLPPSLQVHKYLMPIPKSLGNSEFQKADPTTSLGFTLPRSAKLVTTFPHAFHLQDIFVWIPSLIPSCLSVCTLKKHKKHFILALVVREGRKNQKCVFNLPSLPPNIPIPFLGNFDRKFHSIGMISLEENWSYQIFKYK